MFNLTECRLRDIIEEDLPQLLRWRNEERIRHVMYTDHIITPEEHQRWFDGISADAEGKRSRHWLFEYQGMPLGQVNVTDIIERHKRCCWGFFIGKKDAPRGSGMAMGILAIDRIFTELELNKVCGEALAFNEASIRYHKSLGFQEEGRFRQHIQKKEEFYDVVCFGLLRKEWRYHRLALIERWISRGKEE